MKTKTLQIALIISLLLNAYLLYSLFTVPTANTESTEEAQTETLLTTEMMYESGKSYPLMRIVDGDTIVVGFNGLTQYVRLIGIDAPEPNDPGGPQCYAEEATRHLQEIAQAGIVTLHFDESQGMRDSYGRLLAYVELPDGTDLGAKMIEDGYAHEFAYKATYARQGLYQEAELFAVENEVGLWAEEVCQ